MADEVSREFNGGGGGWCCLWVIEVVVMWRDGGGGSKVTWWRKKNCFFLSSFACHLRTNNATEVRMRANWKKLDNLLLKKNPICLWPLFGAWKIFFYQIFFLTAMNLSSFACHLNANQTAWTCLVANESLLNSLSNETNPSSLRPIVQVWEYL